MQAPQREPKRDAAPFLQEMRFLDRRVRSLEQARRLGVMLLRLVAFAAVPGERAQFAQNSGGRAAVAGAMRLECPLIHLARLVAPARSFAQVGDPLAQRAWCARVEGRNRQHPVKGRSKRQHFSDFGRNGGRFGAAARCGFRAMPHRSRGAELRDVSAINGGLQGNA